MASVFPVRDNPRVNTLENETAERLRILGKALGVLRARAGLTQAEAADRIGVTTQAWQRYEAGERKLLAGVDEQIRLARAVQSNRDELLTEYQRLGGPASESLRPAGPVAGATIYQLPVQGRPKPGADGLRLVDAGETTRRVDLLTLIGPNSGILELADETMMDWAEPGEIVIYDRDRPPRRGHGCVVETNAGEFFVKRHVSMGNGQLVVEQLNPPARRTFDLADLAGVYAVRLRGA